jgi:hypothetical protein
METEITLRLARAIHDRYVAGQVAAGRPFGVAPLVTWEDLSDDLRAANLAQAGDIPHKLAQIGCTIAPATGRPRALTEAEIEQLARYEHVRWSQQRRAAGWTYGPVRNDATKHHDCLVSWDRLSEEEREKDRDVVRRIPGLLAEVGLQVVPA